MIQKARFNIILFIFLLCILFSNNIFQIITLGIENEYSDEFNVSVDSNFYWKIRQSEDSPDFIGNKLNIKITEIETIETEVILRGNFSVIFSNSTIKQYAENTALCSINHTTSEVIILFCYIVPISNPIILNNSIYKFVDKIYNLEEEEIESSFIEYQFSYNINSTEYIFKFSLNNGILLSQLIKINGKITYEMIIYQINNNNNINWLLILSITAISTVLSLSIIFSIFWISKRKVKKS